MARPRVTARRAPSPWAALSPSASVVAAVSPPWSGAVVVAPEGPAFCLATICSAARATSSGPRSWVTSTCSTSTRVRGRA